MFDDDLLGDGDVGAVFPMQPRPGGVDLFENWLQSRIHADRDPIKPEVAAPYRHIWTKWIKHLAGQGDAGTLWHEASPVQVLGFVNGGIRSVKVGRGVSEITRRRYWRLLERIYQYALQHQWVVDNPALNILDDEIPPSEDPKGAILPADLWTAALASFPQGEDLFEVRDRAILMVLFHTALAPQELRQLQTTDVLREPGAPGRARGAITALQIDGSGPRQRRQVMLPVAVAQALQEWLAVRQFYEAAKKHTVVFCSRKSPTMSPHALLRLVTATLERACASARLPAPPRMGPQSVRNTLLVRWLNEGVPPHEVVRAAGLKNEKGLYHLRELVNPVVRQQIAKKIRDDA